MTQHIRCAIALLTVCVIPAASWAQKSGLSAADEKELASYRLTMETLNKVQAASRAMFETAKQDPRFQKLEKIQIEIDALEKKEELTEADAQRLEALEAEKDAIEASQDLNLGSANSIADMEAHIGKVPLVAAALQQAGLTPREYAKFMMAMIQAGFAAGMKKAGMLKELPPGVNPENVKFIEDHEAELKAMQEEWQKMQPGKGGPSDK